ncbi:MAG TPA: 3-hydroxyacyl-ACP dehydratase FabZ [Nitrosomonas sp.]|nr:3-hydroxyacyl-ACP dehydratase FabZ [Nitrosomonas sp.]HMV11395.1 3-hydroxyacyl-ACP dehydratase FabZ [Nitrosomonas sp.]HMW20743.1 3-hydroxyacyl-ACP dehydratase FabZ [Nitrosomonas sp.]HMW67914.1 3-hydroxyacyl-ACP dehydratase FabZ [Nitrosomonas sp.]HMY61144.1 3-hydroxyacyl-ACP dehydratase FabZ [Nitrosomonas sp.]
MSTVMDIHEILKYLPHRYPLILVDRVIDLEPNVRILAFKNVSINEPYFVGHFPHHPVMPGVLIVEALAQAAALLTLKSVKAENDKNQVYYFVGIDGVRFKKPVMAGDQLMLTVEITRQIKGVWKYQAHADVDGQRVTDAELMCTARAID